MSTRDRIVCLVEDEEVLRSLAPLFANLVGFAFPICPSTHKLLEHYDPQRPGRGSAGGVRVRHPWEQKPRGAC